MKNFTLFIFTTLALFFSCTLYDDANINRDCTVEPLKKIPWLKQLVDNETDPNNEDSSGLEIIQYQYNGETVFLVDSCVNNCADSLVVVYDCEKNIICEFGGIVGVNTCPDFDTAAENRIVLFTTSVPKSCDKAVIIDRLLYNKTKASTKIKASIDGNCLQIEYTHSFCNGIVPPTSLIDSGDILESLPPRRRLKFKIADIKAPSCEKIITEMVSFDVSSLATWDSPVVILQIEGLKEIIYTRIPQCGDPNVICAPNSQEKERLALQKMLLELKELSASVVCENEKDWSFTPIGSKACGGPTGYLPYSLRMDTKSFLEKVERYRVANDKFNKKWGIISTCDVLLPPDGVVCDQGRAILVYNI